MSTVGLVDDARFLEKVDIDTRAGDHAVLVDQDLCDHTQAAHSASAEIELRRGGCGVCAHLRELAEARRVVVEQGLGVAERL